jgi:uroporphyrinogen III methyltransferase / synthase
MAKATQRSDKVNAKANPPLTGRRIVITRARAQAQDLVLQLEALGGSIIEFPTIEIAPPGDFTAFDAAVAQIESYHWLIFTSVNGVGPFLARLEKVGKSTASLKKLKVGAIGPETAKKLATSGICACLVPERFQAEGLLDAFKSEDLRGKRVLIPRAAEAREVLPKTLRDWGATVQVVVAYRTVLPAIDPAPLTELLRQREVDVITFTSSSTVKNFVSLFGNRRLDGIAPQSALACIGPITARTVERFGGQAVIVAEEFTIAGLVRAVVEYFQRSPNRAGGRERRSGSAK